MSVSSQLMRFAVKRFCLAALLSCKGDNVPGLNEDLLLERATTSSEAMTQVGVPDKEQPRWSSEVGREHTARLNRNISLAHAHGILTPKALPMAEHC